MHIKPRLAGLFSLVLPVLIAAPHAFAEEPTGPACEDRAAATEHFQRGVDLYKAEKLEGALAEFRDSRTLCPSENNTLNIAFVLQKLHRPLEALDMLDVLKRDFPTLQPNNQASADALRASLERLVGTAVFDGDYPGARIVIDGKDVGTMPQSRPIRLVIGMHMVKIELTGYQPLDTSFVVLPKQNVRVAVALATAPAVREEPPKPPPAQHMFHVGMGFSLTPSLGGHVTDCDAGCSAPPGMGTLITGGYGYRLISSLRIGGTAGYLFLWQARSRDGAPLAGRQSFADVEDDLFLNGFFLGPEISYSFEFGNERVDVGFAVGPMGGALVNTRAAMNGRNDINGTTTFDFVPPSQTSTHGFGAIFTMLQASWRTRWSLAPGWPVHLSLGLLGFAPPTLPNYDARFTANNRNAGVADAPVSFSENLIGSWPFIITAGVTVYHDL
jgi:hypothetical protein